MKIQVFLTLRLVTVFSENNQFLTHFHIIQLSTMLYQMSDSTNCQNHQMFFFTNGHNQLNAFWLKFTYPLYKSKQRLHCLTGRYIHWREYEYARWNQERCATSLIPKANLEILLHTSWLHRDLKFILHTSNKYTIRELTILLLNFHSTNLDVHCSNTFLNNYNKLLFSNPFYMSGKLPVVC